MAAAAAAAPASAAAVELMPQHHHHQQQQQKQQQQHHMQQGGVQPLGSAADLADLPIADYLEQWLATARALLAQGECLRARLVLDAVLQARPACADAHALLVATHLALGVAHWPKALAVARHGVETCDSGGGGGGDSGNTPEAAARCKLALGLALGSVARMTLMPQAERSKHRSEARAVLQEAAAAADASAAAAPTSSSTTTTPTTHTSSSSSSGGALRVAALYALALIDAEGGHYEQAVAHARAALEAAEGCARPGGEAAPIVALIALLLSARQQLRAALTVVEAGLARLAPADRCDCAAAALAARSGGGSCGGAFVQLPRCHDVLLLRVRAQLLLAVADANGALDVLGSARRRLSAARKALLAGDSEGGGHAAGAGSRSGSGAAPPPRPGVAAAAAVLRAQEAQVWRDLALAYAGQQQVADAQLCAAQMQALEPGSAASYHAAGVVAAAARDAAAAQRAYRAALALDAAHAPALLSLGALLRGQGDAHDLSVAAGLLSDALRYEPHSPAGWYHLGLARRAQGHAAEGERHLFTAVTLAAAAPALSYGELPLAIAPP